MPDRFTLEALLALLLIAFFRQLFSSLPSSIRVRLEDLHTSAPAYRHHIQLRATFVSYLASVFASKVRYA